MTITWKKHVTSLFMMSALFCGAGCRGPVSTGLDNIWDYRKLFANKRVGIVANHTARTRDGRHIVDVFLGMDGVTIAALYGPEHGFAGTADAGQKVGDQKGPLEGVTIYSLYGQTRKPTPEMLAGIDVLVFDIQDIGARFYTYVYTMALAMEAAAENDIPFVVLDRPNPITAEAVEGNILEPEQSSFVGMYPIPVRHGMTAGELARMINGQGWLAGGVRAKLTVIPMKNYRRNEWYDQMDLPWHKPSPNMPDLDTAAVYPGLCLLEATNVSEGRGTLTPFMHFGAPWIDAKKLTKRLNGLGLAGLRFVPTSFTPVSIEGMSSKPKYQDEKCYGAKIIVTDRDALQPYWTGLNIISTIHRMYPDKMELRERGFNLLSGSPAVRQSILDNKPLTTLRQIWQSDLQKFMAIRNKYLLY